MKNNIAPRGNSFFNVLVGWDFTEESFGSGLFSGFGSVLVDAEGEAVDCNRVLDGVAVLTDDP